jgi:hypothetical protein
LRVGNFWRETGRVVARLIAEVGRNCHVTSSVRGRNCELDADDELALEDGQRLVEPDDLGLDGPRKHDFLDGHARRRIDREHSRNQQRIAGLVRLNVKAVWKRHLQRRADTPARRGSAFDDGRQCCGNAAKLRPHHRRQRDDDEQGSSAAGTFHFTSRSGMTPGGAGSDDGSTLPLIGGRS